MVPASSRAMDEINEPLLHDLDLPLDAEIELMDWARAAGVSTEDLRRALLGSLGTSALRKVA